MALAGIPHSLTGYTPQVLKLTLLSFWKWETVTTGAECILCSSETFSTIFSMLTAGKKTNKQTKNKSRYYILLKEEVLGMKDLYYSSHLLT